MTYTSIAIKGIARAREARNRFNRRNNRLLGGRHRHRRGGVTLHPVKK
jgi:hypothetical protein